MQSWEYNDEMSLTVRSGLTMSNYPHTYVMELLAQKIRRVRRPCIRKDSITAGQHTSD